MKKPMIFALGFCFLATVVAGPVFAESSNYELQRRIEQLEKRLGLYEKEKEAAPAKWTDKITLNGAVEFDYEYADDSDVTSNATDDSNSELKVGTV